MTQPNSPAVTEQQQAWFVEGWEGPWASKSGGEGSAENTTAFDGGQKQPENLGGNQTTSNIVLTRLYRPGVHSAQAKAWEQQRGRLRTTVSGYDTDPDLGPIGEPRTYADALLLRVKVPDHNSGSSAAGYLELEFAVSGVS